MHAMQTVQDIEGKQRSLSEFANKVAVVVNVASQCGFTDSNYKGLQFLYDKYKDYDFTVRLSSILSRLFHVCFMLCCRVCYDAMQSAMAIMSVLVHCRC